MKNGVKKPSIIKDRRKYSFHRTFGGLTPDTFPLEFSVDSGFPMKDQIAEGLFNGCTGFAQADLCESQDLVPYDERFVYDKTLQMEGKTEGDNVGCLIEDSLKIICSVGVARKDNSNNPSDNKRGAYYEVETSKFDWFDSIRSVILTNFQTNKLKCSVSVGLPWFPEFEMVGNGNGKLTSSGIFPDSIALIQTNTTPWHNAVFSGWKQINGEPYLMMKSWQGPKYGDNGWIYFSRNTVNKLMAIRYTEAHTVAPKGAVPVNTIKINIMMAILSYLKTLLSKLMPQATMTIQNENDTTANITVSIPPTPPKQDMIVKWANAIAHWEGAIPSTNNPGNMKYTSLTASWGATMGRKAADGGYFCQFPTYEKGFTALCNFLILGCEDQLKDFHEKRTLYLFTKNYAGNPPMGYIQGIANMLGCSLDTNISTFLVV